ncbi:MAG: DUF2318 domain-containing protein [Candidatus Accumulibacter sp.]|jgi:uncharacterized membrane protein|nr:DUF2318 domain-containing protein [Accumulibacter sp.]
MLQYLIKITDNTLAAAVVLAFLLFLAVRTARDGKTRLAPGVALGVAAALVYAVLKRNTGFAVREYYDLGVMLPSLALLLLFPALAWKSLGPESTAARNPFRIVLSALAGLVLAYCLPDLLLSPFEFAVGMETIYNADFLYKVIGYAAALMTMFLLGLAVYKMAGKTSKRPLLLVVFAAVLILLLQQSLEVVQILVGRNLIPRPRWLMSLIIALLSHKNGFAYAFMILLALWAAALAVKVRLTSLTGANPAQVRLMRADHQRQLRYCGLLIVCLAVSLITVTALRSYANREVEISPPVEIAAQDGVVSIALDEVNDGNLHRHQFTASGGTAVRFIVIKKSESAYGVGLDACDICGPTGYYQRKDQVVCKLCDVVMNKATIGFPGGCNPVPLKFSVSEGKLRINAEDLEAERKRFE